MPKEIKLTYSKVTAECAVVSLLASGLPSEIATLYNTLLDDLELAEEKQDEAQ